MSAIVFAIAILLAAMQGCAQHGPAEPPPEPPEKERVEKPKDG